MSNIAYVFPGQGAQYFGMGKDFYENYTETRELFDRASDLLSLDMKKMCFEENELLNITEYTQAAMILVCAAILTQIDKQNLNPSVCAGLSLGEYAALISCDCINFDDAIKAVRQRGILMQDTVPTGVGSMTAILGLDYEMINDICKKTQGIVSVANYNCPGQIVITGEISALELAKESCLNAGAKRAVDLKVSGPFHSELLKPAGDKLIRVLNDIEIRKPKIPYVANVTASYIDTDSTIKELLGQQVYSPVKWIQSVELMISKGIDTFIEIGPGKTVSALIKKINKDVKVINIDKVTDLEKLSEV